MWSNDQGDKFKNGERVEGRTSISGLCSQRISRPRWNYHSL